MHTISIKANYIYLYKNSNISILKKVKPNIYSISNFYFSDSNNNIHHKNKFINLDVEDNNNINYNNTDNKIRYYESSYRPLFRSSKEFEKSFNTYLNNPTLFTSNMQDSNFENFKHSKKKSKTLRIIEIDMTKDKYRPTKNEYYVNKEDNSVIEDIESFNNDKPSSKNTSNEYSPFKFSSDYVIGSKDKFPITNFKNIFVKQFNKNINLVTYKYPAYYNEFEDSNKCNKIKGVVYLMHGLYEHSSLLSYTAKILSNSGYDVLSMDLRGHGRSDGIRGLLETKDAIIKDYIDFIDNTIIDYNKNTKKFLFGYSLGGLMCNIISNIHKKNIFNGNILIAPALDSKSIPSKYNYVLKFFNLFFKRFVKLGIPIPQSKTLNT